MTGIFLPPNYNKSDLRGYSGPGCSGYSRYKGLSKPSGFNYSPITLQSTKNEQTMTERDFAYWLQGFFEIANPEIMTKEQIQIIKDHLDLVFDKVTPNRPTAYSGYSC